MYLVGICVYLSDYRFCMYCVSEMCFLSYRRATVEPSISRRRASSVGRRRATTASMNDDDDDDDASVVEARFRSRATWATRGLVDARDWVADALETHDDDDDEATRARRGRHRARATTTTTRDGPFSHSLSSSWTRRPARADRGVPRWARGGDRDADDDDDDARDEDGGDSRRGGKSVKKSSAALTVTTTHDLGGGRRCVTQTWSDVEDGDDPTAARWDAQWDAERRTRDDKTVYATVNAHTVTREVMVQVGSAHEEFGGRWEVRQSATARAGRGAGVRATSWSVGTPTHAYDVFRALHGENDDDDGSSATTTTTTVRKPARERATTREASGKFQWTYDAEKRAARATVIARSKPPSKTSEPPPKGGAMESVGRTLDVQFRATSDARTPVSARVSASASPSPEFRAKLVARGKIVPRTAVLDVELARTRVDAERGVTKKTTLRTSVPLGKYSAKWSRERADGCALAVALARDECVADVRCRFLDRRLEFRAGVKAPCAPFAVREASRRGKGERAPDAFVAIGFAA